jgi:hypothetical protein
LELFYDNRTCIEQVTRLPNGAILTIEGDALAVRQYWDFPFGDGSYLHDRDEVLQEAKRLIRRAVEIELGKETPQHTAIALSGGLDSRVLAASAAKLGAPLNTFTMGAAVPTWPEWSHARDVAAALGARWDFTDVRDSHDVSALWPRFVQWTGGWQTVHQSWLHPAYTRICPARDYRRVLLGYAFDVQLSAKNDFILNGERSVEDIAEGIVNFYVTIRGTPGRRYYTPEFSDAVEHVLGPALRARVRTMEGRSSAAISDYFVWQRQRSYTTGDAQMQQALVHVGFPFLEYELFDLCMRIPYEMKRNHLLYFDLFLSEFPEVSRIPYSATGLPVGEFPKEPTRTSRWLRTMRYAWKRLTRGRFESHACWAAPRFRHVPEFRSAVLKLLAPHRTVAAGIMRPDGIERIIQGIDAGKDYLYPVLTGVVTAELTLAQFISDASMESRRHAAM